MERFHIQNTPLSGLQLLERRPLGDERGYLERMYCSRELAGLVGGGGIAQINHTWTRKAGTIRGLHYQCPPHAEIKFVTCLRGAVFDVAVDVRRDSPSMLRWHAQVLSAENHHTLVIPQGLAHGFQTLTDDCEMLYLHTAAYDLAAERAINALDPRLAITWPLPVSERSARDASHPMLNTDFSGIVV